MGTIGAIAQQGTAQGKRSFRTLYMVTESLLVPAGDIARVLARCDQGDLATGGGYFLNTATLPFGALNVEVFANAPITDFGFEGTGWDVGIINKASVDRNGFVFAVCADLKPFRKNKSGG